MTDTLAEHADPTLHRGQPLIEMENVGKSFGPIVALSGINLTVNAGEVTCVLGDNGAGKSTLIKIISGLHPHTEGTVKVDGNPVTFGSPRDALDHGIATVYQDLAVVSLMEVWRNFFLGSELRKGNYPLAPMDIKAMREIADSELKKMGITVKDINQPIGTLSGGQRQCVAIARAVYFGARVLILDEPTAALGVKQSGVVLKYTAAARDAGLGVVFITHNPHHAFMVGNHFIILKLGRRVLDKTREEATLEELTAEMAGGRELAELSHELQGPLTARGAAATPARHGERPTTGPVRGDLRNRPRRRCGRSGARGEPPRGDAEQAGEVPVQVRLVVEADGCRDVGDRLAVEQPAPGRLHPPADEVAVRWQAELPAEAPHEVGRVGVQQPARFAQRDALDEPGVEQVAELAGQPGWTRRRGLPNRRAIRSVIRASLLSASSAPPGSSRLRCSWSSRRCSRSSSSVGSSTTRPARVVSTTSDSR